MTHPLLWLLLFTTTLAPVTAPASLPDPPSSEQLLGRMSAAIGKLQTLRCNVRAYERHGRSFQQARTYMKITTTPLRIYARNDKGIEVLWVQGQNDGDAWVYPNKFPYVTVSLDPNGSLMRRGQHHNVLDAGYGTIADLVRSSPQRADAYRRSFRYAGDTLVQGRRCHIIRSDFPQFRYVAHKVAKGETVEKIAERYGCGSFRIVERNDVSYSEALPEGKVLQVPNAYGRRTILCIDQTTALPQAVSVWDDKGLFETFEFSQVVANQPIPVAEFSKDFKDYKF